MKPNEELLNDVFLQPWFLPQSIAKSVRRLLPPEYRHKMQFYFEDYGCLRCSKRNVDYGANGMCTICVARVRVRVLWAMKRRWKVPAPSGESEKGLTQVGDAQEMLRDLIRHARSSK